MSYAPYEHACFRADCGGRVCLSAAQHRDAWEEAETFFCSRGHGQVFSRAGQVTYRDLEKRVAALIEENRGLRDEAQWTARNGTSALFEFATCPFDDCRDRRNDYQYASQRTLIEHLDRVHGTDIGARVSWDLAEVTA